MSLIFFGEFPLYKSTIKSKPSFLTLVYTFFCKRKRSTVPLVCGISKISVTKGDLFYIPSGTIHGIGARNLILEIQQSSDITYRIFDYNRRNDLGQLRELHTDKALGAINFEYIVNCKQEICFDGKLQQVISTKNFDIYSLFLNSEYVFNIFDTCFILTCVDGAFSYSYKNEDGEVMYMESLLVPASCVECFIVKSNKAKVLITIPK